MTDARALAHKMGYGLYCHIASAATLPIHSPQCCHVTSILQSALAAARNEALEQCAQLAENIGEAEDYDDKVAECDQIATKCRALKDRP